jgi:NADH:ubiquinone oxidoreductase subunit 6 (subunit J)
MIFITILSSCCFACATFVICVTNPIHAILLLICMFFFGSILLLILNVEFFAIIFLIVYVGAIAVLFLFMVMTLDIKNPNVSQKFRDFFAYKI